MPIAQRKLFMMVMMRSRKPLRMTAGNFVNLSYVNFNAVSRTIAQHKYNFSSKDVKFNLI